MTDTCVCVFAKAPISGQVKTRLVPALSEQQACHVYKNLLTHCLEQIQSVDWQSQLWSTDISHPYIRRCADQNSMPLYFQTGDDLGEKMFLAARQSLTNFRYVIIIGTDCPSIDVSVINEVVKKLKSGCDVVLGPAADGGYVLIGLSIAAESLFNDIEWGTNRVLDLTRTRLRDEGLNWHELSMQRDIDRPADLQYLQQDFPALLHSIGVSLSFPQSDQEPG